MPGPGPRTRRHRAGFSVIELMISLVIIAIMAMAVAPSLSEVLSDNRQHSAAIAVVKFARRARSLAMLTGLSHRMDFNLIGAKSGGGLGVVELNVAVNNRCAPNQTQFQATPAHEWLDLRDPAYNPGRDNPTSADTNRPVIFLEGRTGLATDSAAIIEATAPLTYVELCYQPNGQMWYRVDENGVAIPQDQPLLISVVRTMNTVRRGRVRQILLPITGYARLR